MNMTRTALGSTMALALLCLTSCGALPPLVKPAVSSHPGPRYVSPPPSPPKKPDTATAQFWKEIRNWQGVPYRYGGVSDTGIDCSAFAMRLYESLYGIQLPRTTEEQINAGVPVSQKALRPGDLVFFKFRNNSRHVGIYLSDRHFTHASPKKKGITISCLDNPYWQSRFRAARRILETPPKTLPRSPLLYSVSDRTAY